LTGEFYKTGKGFEFDLLTPLLDKDGFEHGIADPKDNTQVQRNWIPNHDKAIRVADFNLTYNENKNQKTFSGEETKMGNYR